MLPPLLGAAQTQMTEFNDRILADSITENYRCSFRTASQILDGNGQSIKPYSGAGIFENILYGKYQVQIIRNRENAETFLRYKDAGSWTSFIPTGGFVVAGSIGKSDNFNNYTSNGQYSFDTWNVTGSNYPFINGYGVVYVYNIAGITYQISFDFDGGRIAFRRYAKVNSTWGAWKIISGT